MKKTYIISEIGLNHNGSIKLAKEMIIASKESGADAVKFQKRNVLISLSPLKFFYNYPIKRQVAKHSVQN